jgi:hypothetical protein
MILELGAYFYEAQQFTERSQILLCQGFDVRMPA